MDEIKFRLRIFLIVFFSLMVLGTIGFMFIEGKSLIDSIYFIIVTTATVGYGDILPVTNAGKVLALFVIITGVTTFLGVVANATELMLSRRENEARLEKLNMVIGVFFSEVATKLLKIFSSYDPQLFELQRELVITEEWTLKDFVTVSKGLRAHAYDVDVELIDFDILRDFLLEKRDFMLRLLENPVLLEHEAFTAILRSVFHLTEELACREEVTDLPMTDQKHLAGDIKRAYRLLVFQWLKYMRYLRVNYPYLFSLAMRTNPFDWKASPIVK